MAVDIKTLHIGCHVEYEGKRVRICSLKTNMANYDDGKGKPRCFSSNLAYYKRMQPIPITDELLKELGFKYRKSAGGSWCISDKKGGYFYATIVSDSTCIVTHYPKFGFQSRVVCANLHELEAFAYLIAKTELIKE